MFKIVLQFRRAIYLAIKSKNGWKWMLIKCGGSWLAVLIIGDVVGEQMKKEMEEQILAGFGKRWLSNVNPYYITCFSLLIELFFFLVFHV